MENDISKKKKKKEPEEQLYEVIWTETKYQNMPAYLTYDDLVRGRENYNKIAKAKAGWGTLCQPPAEKEVVELGDEDELVETDVRYNPRTRLPTSINEVEKIKSMNFDTDGHMETPADLFTRPDGSTESRLREEYKSLFSHSASSSFFAYLPLSFWKEVVSQTNSYASSAKPMTRTNQNNQSLCTSY